MVIQSFSISISWNSKQNFDIRIWALSIFKVNKTHCSYPQKDISTSLCGPLAFGKLNLFLHHPWGCVQWLGDENKISLLRRNITNSRNCTEDPLETSITERLDRKSNYGFTYSLINSSSWDISPVKPDASATVTLLWHCENPKASPGTPRVNSFTTSAADIALLDARNFSL